MPGSDTFNSHLLLTHLSRESIHMLCHVLENKELIKLLWPGHAVSATVHDDNQGSG